jgi:hypothetical protein
MSKTSVIELDTETARRNELGRQPYQPDADELSRILARIAENNQAVEDLKREPHPFANLVATVVCILVILAGIAYVVLGGPR